MIRLSPLILGITLLIMACSSPDKPETPDESVLPDGTMTTIGNEGGQAPYLFKSPKGTLYLSWTETRGDSSFLKFSVLQADGVWSAPRTITSGTGWFVNWADYPVLSTGDDKHILAHTLRKRDTGTYDYDIWLTRSGDGGSTWQEVGVLHDDGVSAEHGFVSLVPWEENFFISWLDGRNTRGNAESHNQPEGLEHAGAMTLRGAILSPEGRKLSEWELDQRVCDCCQTTAVLTNQGPVVAYRNRSENEIRDIFVVRMENDSWTAPAPVHHDGWMIEGCPVNGPRLASHGDRLGLVWFTNAGEEPAVKLTFSSDAGKSFSAPISLQQANPTGRVDILWINAEEILATWMEGNRLVGARVNRKGEILRRYDIGGTEASRASGFPQTALAGDQFYMAVTIPEENKIQVRRTKP